MKISVDRCLKRKGEGWVMLVWVKEYIIKNFSTCKSLCNLQELYTAFKGNLPNVHIGFSKFCALRPKWCVLGGLKMTHSICVCSVHQNVMLLVDARDCDLTWRTWISPIYGCISDNWRYKRRLKKEIVSGVRTWIFKG